MKVYKIHICITHLSVKLITKLTIHNDKHEAYFVQEKGKGKGLNVASINKFSNTIEHYSYSLSIKSVNQLIPKYYEQSFQ